MVSAEESAMGGKLCLIYPVASWCVSAHSVTDFATFSLWALDTSGPVFPDAARRVPLLETLLADLPVKNFVPPHAGGIFST